MSEQPAPGAAAPAAQTAVTPDDLMRFVTEIATIKGTIAGEVLIRTNPEMLLEAIIQNAQHLRRRAYSASRG